MKTVLTTLLMVGVVAALLGGATYAVFSDTETSVGNQMVAGTIDFAVDGENPWVDATWDDDLGDMKPCVVHYGEFDIQNVGVNPMKLYKRLTITEQNGGVLSEPECVEGGGIPECMGGLCTCEGAYDERCNLASYTLYDMTVTVDGVSTVIIDHANQVRLDNVNGVWIYLGELAPETTMTVNQSYHLSSWDGATEPTVTNWAQGDVMVFNVDLYGEQITGEGPNLATGTLNLRAKNLNTWVPLTGVNDPIGILTFNKAGATFDYDFDATGLNVDTGYSLIYYADPYPGNNPGALIGSATTDAVGALNMNGMSVELNMDLPDPVDQNAPAGAKIWLVPSADYVGGQITWVNPGSYLFEMNLIQYDDTDVAP